MDCHKRRIVRFVFIGLFSARLFLHDNVIMYGWRRSTDIFSSRHRYPHCFWHCIRQRAVFFFSALASSTSSKDDPFHRPKWATGCKSGRWVTSSLRVIFSDNRVSPRCIVLYTSGAHPSRKIRPGEKMIVDSWTGAKSVDDWHLPVSRVPEPMEKREPSSRSVIFIAWRSCCVLEGHPVSRVEARSAPSDFKWRGKKRRKNYRFDTGGTGYCSIIRRHVTGNNQGFTVSRENSREP